MMINIIIVDDQIIFRESLKMILEQDVELKIVGLAENGHQAFLLCSECQPDIILMDICMPGCDGIEGTRLIKEKYPEIKILMLTIASDEENIIKALKQGANGYILKDIKPADLILAIKNCLRGFNIIQQQVINTMAKTIHINAEEVKRNLDKLLTPRELEVVKLIAEGKSNKEIADKIYISEGRTRNIVSEILKKMNFRDRVQIAVFAVRNKLV